MDYQYENLGPERFQHFCQALLAQKFPKIQCFPVGQRDGGRDAITFFSGRASNEFIVFQVKFVRKPLAMEDPHKWLIDIVSEEAPKVKELIPRGAKEYYLLTNIPGTAFPESGSIDAVNKMLNDAIGIPAQCWWRDDLNRRLDNAWNLKWAYPEVLSGTDVLRMIIETGLKEDQERRTNALRAFLRDQYEREKEVRFKQVELQNNLLDLFIDVPINCRQGIEGTRQRQPGAEAIQIISHALNHAVDRRQQRDEDILGAATLLLHPFTQNRLPRIVLEGAPGQGKSTITQYVCQIHRSRILGENIAIPEISEHHRNNPVRLPFRIDLRDLSTWLDGRNPFAPEEEAQLNTNQEKSLESFLSAQIKHHSGGFDFSVADLHAVAKLSSFLIAFDGLDEVADISRRQHVVDEVIKGVNRLGENAVAIQVIVTSRPAAFVNSPGFASKDFCFFELSSITRPLIEEYSKKWLKAKNLHGKEASDVKRILKEKLDQPHLRELARNPMQLAILLSLIHTRGTSLPDKRTALYDSYIELFFSRESEKSTIVRDHRDLLIDIHRYLGWVLHSQAEISNTRGSVTTENLRRLVLEYLEHESHDTALADRLFTGMVERVVALVSRVEGTFEFEVQPLREYFAARFLYDTAPYSPTGAERRGTLPDRFDALCRNFYWFNVTRFYAGCFSKGELPSLVERLDELAHDNGYRYISHPQQLTATLLADWVFTQQPKSMKKVFGIILDGLGFRHIMATHSGIHRRGTQFVLPEHCGNEELISMCFSILQRSNLPLDHVMSIIDLIGANLSKEKIKESWLNLTKSVSGLERTRWLTYGLYLGSLPDLDLPEVNKLMQDAPNDTNRLELLFRSGQARYCEESQECFDHALNAILSRNIIIGPRRSDSILEILDNAINANLYVFATRERQPIPLVQIVKRNYALKIDYNTDNLSQMPKYPNAIKSLQLLKIVNEEVNRSAAEWATDISSWDRIVEKGRSLFGERWAFFIMSNLAAGIKSKQERYETFDNLLDHSMPLCPRVRQARLRASNFAWWSAQLANANTSEDKMFSTLICLTWGGATTLPRLIPQLNAFLEEMATNDWLQLSKCFFRAVTSYDLHNITEAQFDIGILPEYLSTRMAVTLGIRTKSDATAHGLYEKYLSNYDGDDPIILDFCQRIALTRFRHNPDLQKESLKIISKSFSKNVNLDSYYYYRFLRDIRPSHIPYDIAIQIVESPTIYPLELVRLAELKCREELSKKVIPVGTIAERDHWFEI